MSQAEDRALEVFPLKIDGDSRGSYDLNVVKRIIYQQGYEQAEKDLELTWEDVRKIVDLHDKLTLENWHEKEKFTSEEDFCEEVLKRYREMKKK
jgi:hypothetical protein